MKDFKAEIESEVDSFVNSNTDPLMSFRDFLLFRSDERILEYENWVRKALKAKNTDDEDYQKVAFLYEVVLVKIEKRDINSIVWDLECNWVYSIFKFISTENLFREFMIEGYTGYLYKGEIKLKAPQIIQDYMHSIWEKN